MENRREDEMWSEAPERLEDLSRTPSRLIRTHTVRLHVPDDAVSNQRGQNKMLKGLKGQLSWRHQAVPYCIKTLFYH